MPGVPDVYQGTELWDNSLVDPDNRRPVDFAARRALLDRLGRRLRLPTVDADGAAKLLVVSRGAAAAPRPARAVHRLPRRSPPTARPPDHVLAFDRGGAVTVATRLPVGLAAGAAGATPRCHCPTAALDRRAHRGGSTTSAPVAVADLLDRLSGRPAAR